MAKLYRVYGLPLRLRLGAWASQLTVTFVMGESWDQSTDLEDRLRCRSGSGGTAVLLP